MKADKNLYFLAIIPPEPIFSRIFELKRHFQEEHSSKASLKSPPHITLHMPFKMKPGKEVELIRSLSSLSQENFDITLKNFGSFPPRVIFVDVEQNDQLYLLWKNLMSTMRLMGFTNSTYKDRGLTPHMTIAFRDLRKAEFHRAWEKFRNEKFSDSFQVKSFYLLKHDGRCWQPYQEIFFRN